MSALASAVQSAHSVATSLLAISPIQPGSTLPTNEAVKENAVDKAETLNLTGKNIIIGVPGAFTGTCSKQIPRYIENYDQFKAKGIKDIYVVAVNDFFVVKAWKEKLAPNGTPIRFIADDKGTFIASLGLIFDASPLLGGPRAKRFAIVTEGTKVLSVAVESVPSELTVTDAPVILSHL